MNKTHRHNKRMFTIKQWHQIKWWITSIRGCSNKTVTSNKVMKDTIRKFFNKTVTSNEWQSDE